MLVVDHLLILPHDIFRHTCGLEIYHVLISNHGFPNGYDTCVFSNGWFLSHYLKCVIVAAAIVFTHSISSCYYSDLCCCVMSHEQWCY